MLTAYNYYEAEEKSRVQKGMKANPYFEQELRIVEQFTRNHLQYSDKRIEGNPAVKPISGEQYSKQITEMGRTFGMAEIPHVSVLRKE